METILSNFIFDFGEHQGEDAPYKISNIVPWKRNVMEPQRTLQKVLKYWQITLHASLYASVVIVFCC